MNTFMQKLLSENTSELEIHLFDIWHFVYLFVIFGGTALLAFLYHRKSAQTQEKILRTFAYLVIGFYVADFFLMPLSDSYNGISTDKLPFHICTFMGVLVPFFQFNPRLTPVKSAAVTLSIASSLMWMCYPGSALGGQPPFCYLTFQTFMFHGFLFAWGVLNLAYGVVELHWKDFWKVFMSVLIIFLWASLGNATYDHNWFFLKESIFAFLPDKVMPPVVIFCVTGTSFVIYCAYFGIRAIGKKKSAQV